MKEMELKDLRHELDAITGILSSSINRLSAERRENNAYSALAKSGVERLLALIDKLDRERQISVRARE